MDNNQSLMDKINNMSRLEKEKLESSLRGTDTDYVQGYKDALTKACKAVMQSANKDTISLIVANIIIANIRKAMEE